MGKPSVKALRKRLSGRVADHPERFGREGPFYMSWSPFPQGRFWKFTVAVSIGALVPLLAPNFYGVVSTAPMSQLPLVLVPTYLVPTFLILHLTALFQARRLGR
jgi:hypothetical protein